MPLRDRVSFELAASSADWAGQAFLDVFPDGLLAETTSFGLIRLTGWPQKNLSPQKYEALCSRLAAIGARQIRLRAQRLKPWNALVRSRYPVQRLGHFAIVPAWKRRAPLPRDLHPIFLVQGQAFGTGLHESTRLMLKGLGGVQGASLLDVGAGSGILGFAALHLGATSVTCVEVEAAACAELRENRALNRIAPRHMGVLQGAYPLARLKGKRYPLILANLVTPVLVALMRRLGVQLEPGGRLLCSGIFGDDEARQVALAAKKSGLRGTGQAALKDWRRLDLVKR